MQTDYKPMEGVRDLCTESVEAARVSIRAIAARLGTTESTLEGWLSENMRARRYAMTWEPAGFRFRSLACAFEREGHHDASAALLFGSGMVSLEDTIQSLEATQARRAKLISALREQLPQGSVALAPVVNNHRPMFVRQLSA